METLQPASFLMLGVAFCFALVAIMTKRLTMTESTFSILFFMNLMQLPMNLVGGEPGVLASGSSRRMSCRSPASVSAACSPITA